MLLRIDKVDTTRLRNDAHFKMMTDFIDLVIEIGAEALKIKPLIDQLVPLHHQEDEVIKKILKSAITKHIQKADEARDETWLGLVALAKANLKHPDPAVRESARKVLIVLDTYGRIDKKNYLEETSAIYNVLQDLNKMLADIAAIGATAWLTALRDQNAAFDNLMKERDSEEAARCNLELKGIRVSMDDLYNGCREGINAFIRIDGAGDYEHFVKTWNVKLKRYATIIKGKKYSLNPDAPDLQDGGTDDTDDGTGELDEVEQDT